VDSGSTYRAECWGRKIISKPSIMNSADIINISDASNTIAQVGASASPVFSSLLPIGLLVGGVIVGGLLVAAVVFGFTNSIGNLVDRFTRH